VERELLALAKLKLGKDKRHSQIRFQGGLAGTLKFRKLDLESTIVDALIDDKRVSLFSLPLFAAPVSSSSVVRADSVIESQG
jgi:hypothetical protein